MIRSALVLTLCAVPVMAQDLRLPPSARVMVDQVADPDTYAAPVGVFDGSTVPVDVVQGPVRRQVLRVDSKSLTSLQILQPMLDQLEAQGFDISLRCQSVACGGFDFRFGTEVWPAPDMHVDLTDYRFVTARRDQSLVTILVSRSATQGFVQIVSVGTATPAAVQIAVDPDEGLRELPQTDLGSELETRGHVVLGDLTFEVGSSTLGVGPFATLQTLADYLQSNPNRLVALVGHTDSQGSLDANIALSKRRAQAVRTRLIETYGIPAGQLRAEGMGYLAPESTNLTPAGREANRRVEVILVSTE